MSCLQVHLSDGEGMGILTQLLWTSTEQFLETPPTSPPVSPTPSQLLRKFSPKLVVKGEVRAPLILTPSSGRSLVRAARLVGYYYYYHYYCYYYYYIMCVYMCLCTFLVNEFTVVTKKHLYNQLCHVLFQSQVPCQASVAQQQVRDFSFFHKKLTG